MRSDGRARLRDGRKLGYAEFGAPEGKPVFYFHGFPGSRLEAELAHAAAARLGLRLIAVDRPGYGLSDFKPGRTILDWPDDVNELADHLGFDRFIVVGASGGGPYAAACARKIPDRLITAGIICGLGPLDVPGILDGMLWHNRYGLRFYRMAPPLGALVFGLAFRIVRRNPETFFLRFADSLPEPDRSTLRRPDVQPIFARVALLAYGADPRGPSRDLALYARPWGFRLGEISMPVHFWHGESDVVVPPRMAQHQAAAVPRGSLTTVSGEGHFSLIVNHVEEILGVLGSE